MTRLIVYDWATAFAHLHDIRESIEATRTLSPCGADIALTVHISPLLRRYVAGERSPELYEAMIGLTFREET